MSARPPPLPAARGVGWVIGGATLLWRQPLRLLLLGLLLQLIAGVSQIGILGMVFVLLVPAFSAGILQALQMAHAGQKPTALTLFVAFGEPRRLGPLVLLGALMLACALVAAGWSLAGILPQLDAELLGRLEAGDAEALLELDPAILQRTLLGLAAGLLLAAAISYFAVPLVWFAGAPAGQAIGAGLAAMLREWRALLVLGALLGLLSLPVAMLTAMSLTLVAVGGQAPLWVSLGTLLVVVVFQMLLFATQYLAFRDLFTGGPDHEPASSPQQAGEDQLVA